MTELDYKFNNITLFQNENEIGEGTLTINEK